MNLCQLATQAQNGNEHAFTQIYHALHDKVLSKAVKMLQNRQDAEEVVNDVFVKLWQNIHIWDSKKAKFTSWFYAIAQRQIIDYHRYRSRQCRYAGDLMEDEQHALLTHIQDTHSETAIESVIAEEITEQIENALCQMPSRQRLAWILRHYEGYSPKEVAKIMGVKVGSVRVYTYRCKQDLRAALLHIYGD